jgi:hypothetical protein
MIDPVHAITRISTRPSPVRSAGPSSARAAAHLVQTGLREIRAMAERREVLPEDIDSESEFATDVMARMHMIVDVCHGFPPAEAVADATEREMQAAAALSWRWQVSVPEARRWMTIRLEQLGPQYRDMTLAWGDPPASRRHARRDSRRRWAMMFRWLFLRLVFFRFLRREPAPSPASATARLIHHGILEIRLEVMLKVTRDAASRFDPDFFAGIYAIADLCHKMTLALADADAAAREQAAAHTLFRLRQTSSPTVRRWMDDRLIEHFIPEFLTLAKPDPADDTAGAG